MKEEIEAAVEFLTRLIQSDLSSEKVSNFREKLKGVLLEKFQNHWYSEDPTKGQAYRCIRINEFEPVDTVLEEAARGSGLTFDQLGLPQELTMWVDPKEVSCRFGEAKGSFCTVANFRGQNKENNATTLDIDELLQRHQDLKKIEMKKIMYGHNRSSLKTYNRRTFSPVNDSNNVNMSNWSNLAPSSWKAKSIGNHCKMSGFSWLAAEMVGI